MQAVRTLGQFVADEQIVTWLSENVAHINRSSHRGAKDAGKRAKLPVSCETCTATKTCCHSLVVARLFEGIVIAAALRETGRDTPELRAELAARAAAMDAATPYEWRTPCLFLDGGERCTIYQARPTACGALNVYSPPAYCTSRAGEIRAYVATAELAAATEVEEAFRQRLNLRLKVGRRYLGVLPRMALVALEAWDRTDFRDYLRQQPWPSDVDLAKWQPAST